jgi:hypothetical protein
MICLTGDIHHMSLRSDDQQYLTGSEVEAAIEYASIAKDFGVKATFFATGKSVVEEKENFRVLLRYPNVEIGGHTYYAFKPKWLYSGIFNRLICLSNGPAFYQNYEIKKTIRAFQDSLGINIVSWRNHAYRHDQNTYKLLGQNGIKFVSDEVEPDKIYPYNKDKIISVPINVMPDHDHIYHANLTPESTKNWALNRDKFLPELYPIEEWLLIIKKQISNITKSKGTATLLVHPTCMKIADGFRIFENLCKFISSYESGFMRDLGKELGKN